MFPFNGAAGLGSEVVEDSVNSFNFGGDALGDGFKDIIGDALDCCRHGVNGIDSTDNDGISKGACVVLYADRFEIGNSGEILPNLSRKSVFVEFLTENSVRFTNKLKSLSCDCSEAANAETGAGERLTVNHVIGQTESFADNSDFVLEKEFQRFNKLKLKIFS